MRTFRCPLTANREDHQRRTAELRQKLERLIELRAEERMQAELIRREQEQQDPESC